MATSEEIAKQIAALQAQQQALKIDEINKDPKNGTIAFKPDSNAKELTQAQLNSIFNSPKWDKGTICELNIEGLNDSQRQFLYNFLVKNTKVTVPAYPASSGNTTLEPFRGIYDLTVPTFKSSLGEEHRNTQFMIPREVLDQAQKIFSESKRISQLLSTEDLDEIRGSVHAAVENTADGKNMQKPNSGIALG